MTEKRYNVWDIDGTIFLEDHKEGSYHIGQAGNVDINCLNDIANRLNNLSEENEELKKEVKQLKNKIKTYNSTHELLKETIDRLRSDG